MSARIFLLSGAQIDVHGVTIDVIEDFIDRAKNGTGRQTFRAFGKVNETLAIRTDAIAYVAEYPE